MDQFGYRCADQESSPEVVVYVDPTKKLFGIPDEPSSTEATLLKKVKATSDRCLHCFKISAILEGTNEGFIKMPDFHYGLTVLHGIGTFKIEAEGLESDEAFPKLTCKWQKSSVDFGQRRD